MPNLTIKNVPESLLERLRASAERGRRSLNGEVIHRLEASLGGGPVDPEAMLADMVAVRERARLPYLTDDDLRRGREQGRA